MAILGVARKYTDIVGIPPAAGVLIDPPPNGPGADFCFTEGMPMAILGQLVTPHVPCPLDPLHCAAVLVSSSLVVFSNGIGVARFGDVASCLHIVSTASLVTFSD